MTIHDQDGNRQGRLSGNPLGVASILASFFALGVFCLSIAKVHGLEVEHNARATQIDNGLPDKTGTKKVMGVLDSGATMVGQAIICIGGSLVGGTLAIVGLCLGLAGLSTRLDKQSAIGTLLSLSGPLLLILYLFYTQ